MKQKKRKNLRNILMLVCIAMLAGILLPGGHTEAASKKTKALKAYTAFLKKYPSKFKEIENKGYYDAGFSLKDKSYIDEFFLYDTDKNGVPELFTFTYVNFRHYIVRVYTWKGGKVSAYKFSDGTDAVFDNSSVANGATYFSICKKGHIHNTHGGGYGSWEKVYKASNSKLKTIFEYEQWKDLNDTSKVLRTVAKKDGKEISMDKYNSYTKGCTKKKLTFYENNKSGRSKLKQGKCKIVK